MRKILIIVFAMLPLCLMAQRRYRDIYKPAPDEQTSPTEAFNYQSSDSGNTDNHTSALGGQNNLSEDGNKDGDSQKRDSQNHDSDNNKKDKKIITPG